MEETRKTILQMPAIALRDIAVLPDMIIHFDLSRNKSIQAVEQAMMGDQRIFLVAQRSPETNEPGMNEVYDMGTIAIIRKVSKLSDTLIRVLVEGSMRAKLEELDESVSEYLCATVTPMVQERIPVEEEPALWQAM